MCVHSLDKIHVIVPFILDNFDSKISISSRVTFDATYTFTVPTREKNIFVYQLTIKLFIEYEEAYLFFDFQIFQKLICGTKRTLHIFAYELEIKNIKLKILKKKKQTTTTLK